MKKIFACGILLCMVQLTVTAQTKYSFTLQQCIDTALANNVEVRQNALLTEAASVNRNQARANFLPDANTSINHGINQGRSIDPFTNGYVNQAINYGSYGLNSGIVLFSGFSLQNNLKQYTSAFDAARMELQQAKDNLSLNVILSYLQVLNNEDLLVSSINQKELSSKQLERLEVLDRQGAVSPAVVSDLKAQLMGDQLSILDIRNNLESAKLTLAQLMNVNYYKEIKLQRIDVGELLAAYDKTSDEVYQAALRQFSLIKSVGFRKKSAEYALKAAKGLLFPSIALGGSVQTNYSSIAQNATGKIGYNDQIKNNVFTSLNVGLHVPILNGFRTRYNIKLANITVRNSELIEEGTRLQLRRDVEQAYLNMTNAFGRYKTLEDQVAAYTLSFKAAEARFETGVGTSVDYLIAKNNVDRANINLIGAKYGYVLRKKILDYYQNL